MHAECRPSLDVHVCVGPVWWSSDVLGRNRSCDRKRLPKSWAAPSTSVAPSVSTCGGSRAAVALASMNSTMWCPLPCRRSSRSNAVHHSDCAFRPLPLCGACATTANIGIAPTPICTMRSCGSVWRTCSRSRVMYIRSCPWRPRGRSLAHQSSHPPTPCWAAAMILI